MNYLTDVRVFQIQNQMSKETKGMTPLRYSKMSEQEAASAFENRFCYFIIVIFDDFILYI